MPAADLSSGASRERNTLREAVGADPTKPIEAETAFIIYRRVEDGRVVLTNNVNVPIQPARIATEDDMYMMMSLVSRQLDNTQVATLAAQGLMATLQIQAQQMEAQMGVPGA
jgi:hypothetical protein